MRSCRVYVFDLYQPTNLDGVQGCSDDEISHDDNEREGEMEYEEGKLVTSNTLTLCFSMSLEVLFFLFLFIQ